MVAKCSKTMEAISMTNFNFIKTLIAFKILLISLSSFASLSKSDLKIIEENLDYFIVDTKDYKIKHEINKNSGESFITEVQELNDGVYAIVYLTGIAGTSALVEIYYATVVDTRDSKNVKVLGDFPWEYRPHLDEDTNPQAKRFEQPQWIIESGKIKIKDTNINLETSLHF